MIIDTYALIHSVIYSWHVQIHIHDSAKTSATIIDNYPRRLR